MPRDIVEPTPGYDTKEILLASNLVDNPQMSYEDIAYKIGVKLTYVLNKVAEPRFRVLVARERAAGLQDASRFAEHESTRAIGVLTSIIHDPHATDSNRIKGVNTLVTLAMKLKILCEFQSDANAMKEALRATGIDIDLGKAGYAHPTPAEVEKYDAPADQIFIIPEHATPPKPVNWDGDVDPEAEPMSADSSPKPGGQSVDSPKISDALAEKIRRLYDRVDTKALD